MEWTRTGTLTWLPCSPRWAVIGAEVFPAEAWAVPSGRARAHAKSGDGPVEIARMYQLAKGSAVKAHTQAINQLKAVLVSADPNLRPS